MPGDDNSSTSSEDSNVSLGSPTSPSSPTSPNSLRRRKKGKEREEDADRRRSHRRRVRISAEPPIILGSSEEQQQSSFVSPQPAPQAVTEPGPSFTTIFVPENSNHIADVITSSSMLSHAEDVQLHTGASATSWILGILVALFAAFTFPIGLWSGVMIVSGGGFCGSRLGTFSARRLHFFRQLFIAIGRWLESSHVLEYIAIRWMHLVLPPNRRRDPRTLHEAVVRSKQQNSGIHTVSSIVALTAGGVTFFSGGLISALLIGVAFFSFTEIVGTSYLGFVRFAARLNARSEPSIACIENTLSQRVAIAKRSLAPSTPLCFYLAHIGVLGKYFFRVGAILPILPFSRSLPSSARLAAGAVIADAVHDFAVASGALHHGVMPENVPDVVRARSLKYSVLKSAIYSTVLTLITCAIAIGFILGYRVEMNGVTNTTIAMVAFGTFIFWSVVSYFFLARLDNFFSRVFHRIGERIAVIPWIARRRDREALEEMTILFGQTNTATVSTLSLGSSAVAAAAMLVPRAASAAIDVATEEPQRQPVTKEYFDEIIKNNLQEVFKDERNNLIYLRINPGFEPVDPNAASIINSYKNRYFVFDSLNEVFVTVVDDLPPEAAMYYGSSSAGPSGVRIVDVTDDYDIESGLASPPGSAGPNTPPPTPALDEEGEADSQMSVGDHEPTMASSSSSSSSSTNRQLGLFFQDQMLWFDSFKDSKKSAERDLKLVKFFPDYFLSKKQKTQLDSYEISMEDLFYKEEDKPKYNSSTQVAKVIVFNYTNEEETRTKDEEEEQGVEDLMKVKQEENLIPEGIGEPYVVEPPKKPDIPLEKEMMPTFWNCGLYNMDAIMLLGMLTLPFNKVFSY